MKKCVICDCSFFLGTGHICLNCWGRVKRLRRVGQRFLSAADFKHIDRFLHVGKLLNRLRVRQ